MQSATRLPATRLLHTQAPSSNLIGRVNAGQLQKCHLNPRRLTTPTRISRRPLQCLTTASAVPVATSLLGNSTWGLWAALACAGAAGLQLERTKWGKEMSGALLSTLIGLALSNLGVIPSEAPHVSGPINAFLLPLAVPLLLFAADLKKVIGDTGRLLTAFIAGSVATVAGSFTAFSLMPLETLGADGWKVAGALTARHIGGSVNYMVRHQLLLIFATR